MDLPQIDLDEFKELISKTEEKGHKDIESFCYAMARTMWAEQLGFDDDDIGELIRHHNITVKFGAKPTPKAIEAQVAKTEKIAKAPIGDKVGGKGKKQCPACHDYCGVRTQICDCGHQFVKKEVEQPKLVPQQVVHVEESEPEPTVVHFDAKRFRCRVSIHTPAGPCPVRLHGTDRQSVEIWSNQLRERFYRSGEFLKLRAIRYYLYQFYDMQSEDFQMAKQQLLDIYQGEDFN